MSWQEIVFGVVLIVMLVVTAPVLGRYMANVYGVGEDGTAPLGDRFFGPIERFIYRICGIDHRREQRWNVYALVADRVQPDVVAGRSTACNDCREACRSTRPTARP